MSRFTYTRALPSVLLSGFLIVGPAAIAGSAPPGEPEAASTAQPAVIPPPPPPGQCGPYYIITTSGAEASVRECRTSSGSLIRVNGSVIDTDNDGQCAQVHASYNVSDATDYSARACPQGGREYFTFPWRSGTNAFIYLREFDV